MNQNLYRSLLLLFIATLILSLIPSTGMASANPSQQMEAWKYKFHPSLLAKVKNAPDNEVFTLMVRLQPLPASIAEKVRGHHDLAVKALKEWADITQMKIIPVIRDTGGVVLHRFWIDNAILVKAPLKTFKTIAQSSLIVKVLENFRVHVLDGTPAHPVEPKQQVSSWGIFKINAPGAWSMGFTGQGVRIAVLDTGVDITHPALQGKMLTLDPNSPYYPGGWMEFDQNGNPVLSQPHDTHGHGTHTSGTALGGDTQNILIGVAPGATLMHGLVLPGGSGTFAEVLAGIEWAVDPFYIDPDTGSEVPTGLPAHVISMSLGASNYYGDDLFPGIEGALLANIIVVAAIGNDGPQTSSNPGNIWGVFGVGATDINDNVAYFSSGEVVNWPNPPAYWPFFDTYPSQYIKPDFSAPGVSITSSVPGGGYEAWDGTSMATPHVAGTVALILQAAGWTDFNTPDTPEKVYQILNATSVDLGDPGQDTRYGWGRIDAQAAVQEALKYAKHSGVEGFVLDKIDNTPIPWAQVTVEEINKTVGVNGTGYFRIPLDPGTYHLTFTAWGYVTKSIEVVVKLLNGTIAGFVVDEITGQPIANATVNITGLNFSLVTFTDANGSFNVSVKPGTYNVSAVKIGYFPAWTTVKVNENETSIVVLPLLPQAKGVVKGYVTDINGTPLANATVMVAENGLMNITDTNGYYELHLYAGQYTIIAWKYGYKSVNTTVSVAPNSTVWANFTLQPIPPEVVVIGNVRYDTQPHLADLISSLGYPVVSFKDVDEFFQALYYGEVNPRVVVVDHFKSDGSSPSFDEVAYLLMILSELNITGVFLGTSYSGTTAIGAFYDYSANLTAMGFPGVVDYETGWPEPQYVLVDILNASSPLFTNVTPINDSWFYLADPAQSDYADYLAVEFNSSVPVNVLAIINDTHDGTTGVGAACWISPQGAPWFYLSSWGESYWMQYLEPGSDGVYSDNTAQVLLNAVKIGFTGSLNITVNPAMPKLLSKSLAAIKAAHSTHLKPEIYTFLTVLLDRQPYGYVEGSLVGSDGVVLAGASVSVLGTPIHVVANATGGFRFWLPAGNYTLLIHADGYADLAVNVSVSVNATTSLGSLTLKAVPRIAILYDHNGEIKNLIENSLGWYAKDYSNITELTSDVATGFYSAVIHAGYYYAPMPSEDEFEAMLNVTSSLKLGVIFLDQWDYASQYPDIFGYGIRCLNEYLGDPASRTVGDTFDALSLLVTQSHPVLRGYKPGDIIELMYNPQSYGTDYSYFTGFSGTTIGQAVFDGAVQGDAIAWKILPSGSKWLLMAGFAPEEYQDMSYWTYDAMNILLNGVVWASTKPVNLTLENTYLHVGDLAVLHISGAPAGEEFTISIDDVPIGNVTTDSNGTAVFEFTVPVLPGGQHIITAESADMLYMGMASFYILAEIDVSPTAVTAPALVHVEATGLYPYQSVMIYLDGNYLSFLQAGALGTIMIDVNIPVVASGTHHLLVIDSASGSIMADAELNVTSQLDIIQGEVSSVNTKVDNINGILSSIKGDIATIKTDTGTIKVKLDQLNASIIGFVKAKSGEIMAVLNTTKGTILASLSDLSSMMNEHYSNITVKLDTIISDLNKLLNQTSSMSSRLSSLEGTVTSLQDHVNSLEQKSDNLAKNVTEAKKKAEDASGSSGTATMLGGGAIVLSLIAMSLPFVMKR